MRRIGTAGWTLPRSATAEFPSGGSHLERYSAVFNAVEINSTFYRPHQPKTFQRWAATVPEGFQFSLKVPKHITHELRLVRAMPAFETFLRETEGLGEKRGPLLLQLPPSFALEVRAVTRFLEAARRRHHGPLAIEPRHPTWFTAEADALLGEHRLARVAADPACVPAAATPGGSRAFTYRRFHGSPRTYYSAYGDAFLQSQAGALQEEANEAFCIFDNTALGHATLDALRFRESLRRASAPALGV